MNSSTMLKTSFNFAFERSYEMENKIVMVGLGIMGMPMAKNILKSGLDLSCCDISWDSLKSLEGLVPSLSTVPEKVAKNRNVVITMLPTSDIV